jgi:hypothetical protein
MKAFERRYHASWVLREGLSPLAKLGMWMVEQEATLQMAPHDLLEAAVIDVTQRLPGVAAREPTRRHRKHFAWLLRWLQCLVAAIGGRHVTTRGSQIPRGDRGPARDLARVPARGAEL